MDNRDITLDIAKGALIILVAMGHSLQYTLGPVYLTSGQFFYDPLYQAIYSFHMPLFMLISGYLFYHSNQKPFVPLAVSKLRHIGIPMLSFVFLCNIPSYAKLYTSGQTSHIIEAYISDIFPGVSMWFLVSLLLNCAIISILTRIFKSKPLLYASMLVLFGISLFTPPDSIVPSVHKYMFPFFCIGYIVRQSHIDIYICLRNKRKLCLLTLLSALALWWFDKDTFIYTSGYCIIGNMPQQLITNAKRMIIAMIGSYTFIQYCHALLSTNSFIKSAIIRLGQISLFIYGLNMVFCIAYKKALSILSINFEAHYLIAAVTTLLFLIVSYYLYKLLDKWNITRIALLGRP